MTLSTCQMIACGGSPFLVQNKEVEKGRAATSYSTMCPTGYYHLVRLSTVAYLLWSQTVERRMGTCFVALAGRMAKSSRSNRWQSITGNIGKEIAEVLNLANPKECTGKMVQISLQSCFFLIHFHVTFIAGHTFRGTSTLAAADEGATCAGSLDGVLQKTAKKYLDNSKPQL